MAHDSKEQHFNQIVTYLIENTGKNHRIEPGELHTQFLISTGYICRVCKEKCGLTTINLIGRANVKKAIELYHIDNLPEKVIFRKLGLQSISSLDHLINKHTKTVLKKCDPETYIWYYVCLVAI